MINLNNRNYQLFEQYNKLKIITGDSFQELGIENVVKKAIYIANDPREIWDTFNNDTPGFFTKCIMQDYNIDTNFTAKILREYKKEI